MKQPDRGRGWKIGLVVPALGVALVIATTTRSPRARPPAETPAAPADAPRAALVARGLPELEVAQLSESQVERALGLLATNDDPEVVLLRLALDRAEAPESSACALARDSDRATKDPRFARDVERICVVWRKLMWDYAEAHADEVERDEPGAVERARNVFAALDAGLMLELMKAGGGEVVGAAPTAPMTAPTTAAPDDRPDFAPQLGDTPFESEENP